MLKKNLKSVIREEIALEGLDGITFQALWIRIAEATNSKHPYTDKFKQYIWHIIKLIPSFEFYELPEPRPDLITFDRFNLIEVPEDIYPHCPVDDTVNKIKGSCSTYHTRINITNQVKSLNYEEVFNQWGSKFVIVASQKLREEILFECKSILSNATVIRYCMLERIGRSRYNGEITYGHNSLASLGEDPKSLFYHRKSLLEDNVIKKQIYNRKWGNHAYNGTLLHLRRFYREEKSKFLKHTEILMDFLKSKDNLMAAFEEVNELLTKRNFKMLKKIPEFYNYFEIDSSVPYRTIHPNATKEEWQLKAHKREKLLHVVRLKDPSLKVENPIKTEPQNDKPEKKIKTLDCSRLTLNQSYLTQACIAVRSFGNNGCSEIELREYLGLPRLTSRILLRNLERKNMLASFLIDDGRQRINKYCYKKFENDGEMAQKFDLQRKETLELILDNIESNVPPEKMETE